MGYIVCIAEKPSVAKDIAEFLGAANKKNGYYEGNGYKITWAVGHLIGLSEPEEYNELYNDRKNMDILPFVPKYSDWKWEVIEKTKSQYNIIKKLFNDEETDYIIDCGDCGNEGHYLQWLIRKFSGTKKEVKRFITTSYSKEAIEKGFANLQPIEKYEMLCRTTYLRAIADLLIGINMSRIISYYTGAFITVGRCQTPALFLVVKRWLEIQNFKPTYSYQIQATTKSGLSFMFFDFDNYTEFASKLDSEGRLLDEKLAISFSESLKKSKQGEVLKVEKKGKSTNRPQLFSLDTLQMEASEIYDYKPEKVLNSAQRLYECYKITTYPRCDSNYLTEDMKPFLEPRIKEISKLEEYKEIGEKLLKKGLLIDDRIINSDKVSDHHAIIVTENIKGWDFEKAFSNLREEHKKACADYKEIDKNILGLIISRMLVALSDKYKYFETEYNIKINDYIFKTKTSEPVELGWKYTDGYLKGKDKEIPLIKPLNIKEGGILELDGFEVINKQTTAPQPYTNSTLLSALIKVEIGTSATRSSIIEVLYKRGCVEDVKKAKQTYIIPTKKGINTIQIMPKELVSTSIVADWEKKFIQIRNGDKSEQSFLDEMEEYICYVKKWASEQDFSKFCFDNKEVVCKCPLCKNDIYKKTIKYKDKDSNSMVQESVYVCSDHKKDGGCPVIIYSSFIKKKFKSKQGISINQAVDLLSNKVIDVNCKNSSDVSYKASFKYGYNEKTKKYGIIFCGFPTKGKKSKSTRKSF